LRAHAALGHRAQYLACPALLFGLPVSALRDPHLGDRRADHGRVRQPVGLAEPALAERRAVLRSAAAVGPLGYRGERCRAALLHLRGAVLAAEAGVKEASSSTNAAARSCSAVGYSKPSRAAVSSPSQRNRSIAAGSERQTWASS